MFQTEPSCVSAQRRCGTKSNEILKLSTSLKHTYARSERQEDRQIKLKKRRVRQKRSEDDKEVQNQLRKGLVQQLQ